MESTQCRVQLLERIRLSGRHRKGFACGGLDYAPLLRRARWASFAVRFGILPSQSGFRRNDGQKNSALERSVSFRSTYTGQAGLAPSSRTGDGGKTGASCCRRVDATARSNGSPQAAARECDRRSRDRR